MVVLDCIVILTAAPILEPVFKGGAQRVLRDTYDALHSISCNCIVLQPQYQEASLDNVYIASHIADGERVEIKYLLRDEAASLVRHADLTLSVDNSFHDLPQNRWHVLSLSNLAYDTERTAVQEGQWNRVWVPSEFLRGLLVSNYHVQVEKIDVIPPTLSFHSKCQDRHDVLGILGRDFARDKISRSHRLLFPHRSDPAKGIQSAIALLRRLTQDDRGWRLIITAPSRFDDPANQEFFKTALQDNIDMHESLVVIPWLPYNMMSELYAMSGCTIMSSILPESFGLAAVESVCCGTPVVSLEAGALSREYSDIPEIHFVDAIDSTSTAHLVGGVCGTYVSPETVSCLKARFSVEEHQEAVRRAVARIQENV